MKLSDSDRARVAYFQPLYKAALKRYGYLCAERYSGGYLLMDPYVLMLVGPQVADKLPLLHALPDHESCHLGVGGNWTPYGEHFLSSKWERHQARETTLLRVTDRILENGTDMRVLLTPEDSELYASRAKLDMLADHWETLAKDFTLRTESDCGPLHCWRGEHMQGYIMLMVDTHK